MAKMLGMPWCAITDEDKEGDSTIKKNTEISRQELAVLKTSGDRSLV